MKALFLFLLFVAATEAIGTINKCSTKMTTPNLCGLRKTCDYKADQCKDFISTADGTCLNDNKVIDKRPALLISSKVAIFKLSVNNPTGSDGKPSQREQRCGLHQAKTIDPHGLPEAEEGIKTNIARAAVEILDAIYWVSDIGRKKCANMRRFTLAIAVMSDGKIYLAGNLDFSSIKDGNSDWKTFELGKPGVRLAIQYILTKWDFPTEQVFVLQTTVQWHYMGAHAEMQLVSFAKANGITITQLGVSKPPCCKCDAGLTEGDYKLANTMEVFSGPGTQICDWNKFGPWCGHQYGAYQEEVEPLEKSWKKPQQIKMNQVTKIKLL